MRKPVRIALLIAASALALPVGGEQSDAPPAIISGYPAAVDGDTLKFAALRVRLLDIDAPELDQLCLDGQAKEYPCGEVAGQALAAMIRGQLVTCQSVETDNYGRPLATCDVAGRDLGIALVEAGHAVPYRDCACPAIQDAAGRAKAANAGVWGGVFLMPWEWRKTRR